MTRGGAPGGPSRPAYEVTCHDNDRRWGTVFWERAILVYFVLSILGG